MDENILIEKYFDKIDEVNLLLNKFSNLDESKKSQFVAKLIGLGVLKKDKKGKLKPGKNKMTKDEVIKKLNKGK